MRQGGCWTNPRQNLIFAAVATSSEPLICPVQDPASAPEGRGDHDPVYAVICWDDPVNLMEYVTHVFQKVFGWDHAVAHRHMLEVHEKGKSVLTHQCLERAEFFVSHLRQYHLHASMEPAS